MTVAPTISSRADWAAALLSMIGAPVSQNNINTIVAWESAEGGAGPQFGVPNNTTNYNPINITLVSGPQGYGYDPGGAGTFYPGASPTSGNDPPVASFSDWQTGLVATAARLQQPFAQGILTALQTDSSESTVAAAVGASGWGTGDFSGSGTNASVTSSSGGTVSATSSSGKATAGGGQAGAPYVPSIIPGVPAVAPQTPDFTYVPTNEIGRVVSWAFEFGAWGLFITIVFAFGAILLLLGAAMIVMMFAQPVAAPVAQILSGGTPGQRAIKSATRGATGIAKGVGRAGQATGRGAAGAGRQVSTSTRNAKDRLSQGGDRRVAQRAADQAPRNKAFANTEAQRRGIPASELRRQNTRPKSKSPERVERRRQHSRESARRLEKQGYDREPF